MSRSRSVLLASVFGAASCTAELAELPRAIPPTASMRRAFTVGADGQADLVATIDLSLRSDGHARTFDLDDLSVAGSGSGPWVIDQVDRQGSWPVSLPAGGARLTLQIVVRAHAPLENDVPPQSFTTLRVTSDRDVFDVVPAIVDDTYDAERCPTPALEPTFDALGATIDWSAATLPGLVEEPLSLTVGAGGRAWMLATYWSAFGVLGARVFGAKDGVVAPILELREPRVSVAPGGAADTLLVATAIPQRLEPRRVIIERLDADLDPTWSRTIALGYADVGPPLAVSAGRVLVAVEAPSPLTIDGALVGGASADAAQLILFDETTGDVVTTLGGVRADVVAPVEGGGFAIGAREGSTQGRVVCLEADLTERWSLPLRAVAIASALDGTLWVSDGRDLVHVAADGAILETIASAFATAIAPLEGGALLVGTEAGVARVSKGGAITSAALAPQAASFCSAEPRFLVAAAPGGAMIAARPRTPEEGTSAGRGLVARLSVE